MVEVSPDEASEFEREIDLDAAQRGGHHHGSTAHQDRGAHLNAASGAVVRMDEVVAGYIPGVNIVNGADLYAQQGELVGREWTPQHRDQMLGPFPGQIADARPQPARQNQKPSHHRPTSYHS